MSKKINPAEGVRVTSECRPKHSRGHDMRIPGFVENQKYHIDFEKHHITILDFGEPEQAYEKIFGDSIKVYNNSQKRKDRRITDYLRKVIEDERQGIHKSMTANSDRKPFYQFIHYLGNRDFHCPDDKAEKILTLFVTKVMPKKYPNFISTNINGHGDEYSYDRKGNRKESPFHIHQTGVFVAHALTKEELKKEKEYRAQCKELKMRELEAQGIPWNEEKWKKKDWRKEMVERWGKSLEKGMQLQTSLSAALAEMGFYTEKGKGTAQQQFEEAVRHDLMDFAEEMGVKINRTKGHSHKHDETDIYSQKSNNLEFEQELIEREKVLQAEELFIQNKIDDFDYQIENLEERELKCKREEEILKNLENTVKKASDELIKKENYFKKYESEILKISEEIEIREQNVTQREMQHKENEEKFEKNLFSFSFEQNKLNEEKAKFASDKKKLDDEFFLFSKEKETFTQITYDWQEVASGISETEIVLQEDTESLIKNKKSIADFCNSVKRKMTGIITKIKQSFEKRIKSLEEIINGYQKFYVRNGNNIVEYKYGLFDFSEMLLNTPVNQIESAINECKKENKNTFAEMCEKNNYNFFERYFDRARDLKRERELKLKRLNGKTR